MERLLRARGRARADVRPAQATSGPPNGRRPRVRTKPQRLRFRSGDHVVVTGTGCACGRRQPKIRCFGRTDDMLIVRGVNLFPSAVQDIVEAMRPLVSGQVRVIADFEGHSTQSNLKLLVERAEHETPGVQPKALKQEIEARIRGALAVKADVWLAPHGSIEKPGAAKVKLVWRAMPSIEA